MASSRRRLNDYVRHGLFPDKVGTPEYREILAIEDPYNYRDRPRLKMPKFVINASGDQFFLPDNSQFYYNELPEEKHLRYVPNAKHNLEGSDARESLAAFYQAVLDGTPRPKFSWKKESDGTLRGHGQGQAGARSTCGRPRIPTPAISASTRSARPTPARRSRRRPTAPTSAASPSRQRASRRSSSSWSIRRGKKYPFKFTTEVSVVPDVLPFKMPTAAK